MTFIGLAEEIYSNTESLVKLFSEESLEQKLNKDGENEISDDVVQMIREKLHGISDTILYSTENKNTKNPWREALEFSGHQSSMKTITFGNCMEILKPVFETCELSTRILELPRRLIYEGLGRTFFYELRKQFKYVTEKQLRKELAETKNETRKEEIKRMLPEEGNMDIINE